MPIRCNCGHCKTEFLAPERFAGRTLACPVCEKRVLVPGGPPRPPEPVKGPWDDLESRPTVPKPIPDLVDVAMGPVPASSGGEEVGIGSSHLEDAWASDGRWRGMGRRSRREEMRIPLHAAIAVFAIGALVFCLLVIAALPHSAAVIGWVVFWTAGVGLILLGLGWEALIAMRQPDGPGIFVLIPPVDLYYFMDQWDKTRRAFLTVLAGAAVCGGSFGAIRLAEYLTGEDAASTASSPRPKAESRKPKAESGKPKAESGEQKAESGALDTTPASRFPLSALPEAGTNPIQRAFDEASRQYAIRTAVDLIAGDDAELAARMSWFPAGGRPVMGLRWGLGVEVSDPANPAVRAAVKDGEVLIGSLGMALLAGLEGRIKAGAFGQWPEQGDPRLRQVSILPTGTRAQLLAAARSRRLDMLVLFEPVPLSSAAGQVTQTLVQAEILDAVADKSLRTFQAPGGDGGAPGSAAGDPVAAWVADVLAYLRENCELVPVPALTVEEVRARLKQSEPEKARAQSALLLLVELRYYQVKHLLTVEESTKEQDALLGPGKGRLLATGPPAKRREVVQAWLKGLGTGD